MSVKRGFAEIAVGQLHYRFAGRNNGSLPLLMLHASPGSSRMLEPLIAALGENRQVIAPDTPGNGDSVSLGMEQPEIKDYADAIIRFADSLGIERFDLYGTHTGARIACDLSLHCFDRIRRLVLDGFGVYTPDQIDEILHTYAPAVQIDQNGTQIHWAWNMVRDQYVWFPHFKKDDAHRVPLDLPSAEFLHAKCVEILKAVTTYHLSYRAAFRFSMREHVPKIKHPTMITFADTDMVASHFDDAARLLPGAYATRLPGITTDASCQVTAKAIAAFLQDN